MNILHICSLSVTPNGIRTVLEKLFRSQKELGNNVRVITLSQSGNDFEFISSVGSIIKNISSFKPDIIIFHSVYHIKYILLAFFLWRKKISYAITLHGALSKQNYRKGYLKKRIANIIAFNNFIKRASSIIYLNNNEYKNSIVRKINNKCTIIPNGCDRVLSLDLLDYSNNDKLEIVYIGRIERYHKGLDVLLPIIKSISHKDVCDKVRFVFYGDGRESECRWFKNELKVISNIAEYKGAIYGEQKDRVLRNANIFILTSRSEGMPMGVLEALSYGVPCILTHNTNMGDEIENAFAGWVTTFDPIQIQNTIEKAIDEYPIYYKTMQINALNLSKKYYWNEIAMRSVMEYDKCLNTKG